MIVAGRLLKAVQVELSSKMRFFSFFFLNQVLLCLHADRNKASNFTLEGGGAWLVKDSKIM